MHIERFSNFLKYISHIILPSRPKVMLSDERDDFAWLDSKNDRDFEVVKEVGEIYKQILKLVEYVRVWYILCISCMPKIRLILLSILFTFWISSASVLATNYYVANSGSDLADGQSVNTPWQTLAKVFSTALSPGDTILLNRGNVWHEPLIIGHSGTNGQPITYGAYGNGNNPIIDGTSQVINWSVYQGNIYVADVGSDVSRVFIDQVLQQSAHYPNTGYLKITQDSANKHSLVSSSFNPSSNDLIGAGVSIRNISWWIENETVSSYDSSTHTITWSTDTQYPNLKDWGFYLTNKLWMLDQPGEWYYDSSAHKLYLWPSNGLDPNTHEVDVNLPVAYTVTTTNTHDITIQDIDIRNSPKNALEIFSSKNIIAQRLNITNPGRYGMYADGTSDNLTFRGNTVDHSFTTGIMLYFIPATSIIVENNTVTNTGNGELFVDPLDYPNRSIQSGTGIFDSSDNVIIRNNTISNSNYNGMFIGGTNNTVQNNIVRRSCLILDDCGGIYATTPNVGNKILNNIVSDSIGNFNGTAYNFTQAHGIYLDQNSNHVTVSGNTVSNVDMGIIIHDSNTNTITNNTVYLSRINGLKVVEDFSTTEGTIKDNLITGNIFFNGSITAPSAQYDGFYNNINFGTYNNNKYSSSYFNYPISQRRGNVTTNYSLTDWKNISLQDSSSTDIGSFFKSVLWTINSYLSDNLNTNNWSNWSSNNSAIFTPIASCDLGAQCFHVVTSVDSSQFTTNRFAIESGKTYEISFSTSATSSYSLNAVIAQAVSPWTNYAVHSFIAGKKQTISYLFTAPVTQSDTTLTFYSNTADYYLNNVSIRPVDVTIHSPTDDSALFTNSTFVDSTISLDQKYCDLDNNPISGNLTLAPFSSKILLKQCNSSETNSVSTSNSTQTNNNNSAPSCNDAKPSSFPNLFQINTSNKSAKIFFTPISNTNQYYVSFSTKQNAEENGVQVTLAREGVQNFSINLLKSNTTYYVKVRGQNGCTPGEWSNVMKFKTNFQAYYKNQPNSKISIYQPVSAKVIDPPQVISTPVAVRGPQPTNPPISLPQTSTPVSAPKRCFLWWCF